MKTEIAVCHTIASLHPSGGGPSQTVVQLSDALAYIPGLNVTLMYQSKPGASSVGSSNSLVMRRQLTSHSTLALSLGLPMRSQLAKLAASSSLTVIHDNGLWAPVNQWSSWVANRFNIPHVIQTHGMLSPWALAHKRFKKRIALAVYQWRALKRARVFVATATAEYEHLRALGLRQPIAVIPNGIRMPAALPTYLEQRTHVGGPRTVLFLGRIYPVKGLLNLVDAWAQVRPEGWRLHIAGPDEDRHLAEVLARVRKFGLTDTVVYKGEVVDEAKASIYQDADLFILPSFTENFGVVVAEALSYGLPVITTRGAPWADLETFGCGWWVELGVDPLVHALRKATTISDEERREMGARGREYVRRYDWDTIAEQTIEVYRWVLGQGDKPDCVRTD